MVLSVAPFSFADLTWGPALSTPQSAGEAHRYYSTGARQNPMKTVATLLAGNRNGEAAFKK